MISRVLAFACPLLLSLTVATLPQSGTGDSFYMRGTELARSGNFQQALQELKQSAELSPQNPKVHNMLGVVLTQLGQLKEANEAYSRALSLSPGFLPARKNRAVNSFTRGDFKFAAAEFEVLVRIEPNDLVPHLFLGLLAFEHSDFQKAKKQLLEARQLSPDNSRVLLGLTRVYLVLGERQLALESAHELQTKSRSQEERFELGVVLAQFEIYPVAEEIFRDLWKRKASSYDIGFNLALVQYRNGNFEGALRTVEDLSALAKPNGELLNLQGWIYNKMRRWDKARESLRQAIVLEPDNADHYLDLSAVLKNEGATEAAIQVLLEGLRHDVDKDRLQVEIALFHQESNNYGSAENWFSQALQTNPASEAAYLGMAGYYLASDRRKEALGVLEKAIKSLPDSPVIHYGYAAELLESIDGPEKECLERAAAALQHALELDPYHANSYFLMGRVYVRKGDDAKAQYYFEKACAFNPKHSTAYFQLSRIAVRRGDKEKAAQLTQIVQRLRDEWREQERETFSEIVQERLRGTSGRTLISRPNRKNSGFSF